MTSIDHYLKAERLLAHAAAMAAENVGRGDLAELLERPRLAVDIAATHATLAAAANSQCVVALQAASKNARWLSRRNDGSEHMKVTLHQRRVANLGTSGQSRELSCGRYPSR
jgi:hypothetical protein